MKAKYHSSLTSPKIKCAFFNFMFLFFPRKQTFICFIFVGVYFGKAVTIPFIISHQKSLHKLNGEPAAESNTSPSGKRSPVRARVSVFLALRSLWSNALLILCIEWSKECCTSNRICELHERLCCRSVCVCVSSGGEQSSCVSRGVYS